MLVNVVFPGWVPVAYLAESQNIPGWLEAPAQALRYPFRTFVGGHLTRLGGPPLDRPARRADVYTVPNAYQLVESLRIDYSHLGPFGIHS